MTKETITVEEALAVTIKLFKELQAEKKLLDKKLAAAEKIIDFVKNASAPACKGTVLEMIHRKVIIFQTKK